MPIKHHYAKQSQRSHFKTSHFRPLRREKPGFRTRPFEQPHTLGSGSRFASVYEELKHFFPNLTAVYDEYYNHPNDVGTKIVFRAKGNTGIELQRVHEGMYRDVDDPKFKIRSQDRWRASYGQIKASYLGKPLIQDLWVEHDFLAGGATLTESVKNLLSMLAKV